MSLSIEEINSKYDLNFDKNYEELFDIIIQIFNNKMNLDNYDLSNSKILNIIGLYYYYKEINYTQAIQYYLMAIKLGNSSAMNNLALYYYEKEKDYTQTIKYFLMAIDLDDAKAMYNLSFITTVSPIKVFMEIDLVENPNEFMVNLKAKLKKNHKVIIFENKKRL